MTELPHPWDMYALHQQRLAARSKIDDRAWGIEAVLDAICAGEIQKRSDIRLVEESAARRERYRSALRGSIRSDEQSDRAWIARTGTDGELLVSARSDLARLWGGLSHVDLTLLVADATTNDRKETAAALQISSEALRTKIKRARRRATKLVAV